MAIENAKQFVEKVQADAALAERVKGMTPQESLALAKEMGLEFTEEELKQATEDVEDRELSPEELEQGVGGARHKKRALNNHNVMSASRTCSQAPDGRHQFVYEGHFEVPYCYFWSHGYDRYVCTLCGDHDDKRV